MSVMKGLTLTLKEQGRLQVLNLVMEKQIGWRRQPTFWDSVNAMGGDCCLHIGRRVQEHWPTAIEDAGPLIAHLKRHVNSV